MINKLLKFTFKFFKRLFLFFFIVVLAAVLLAYYLLGTENGYRLVPAIISTFTPYEVGYSSLNGQLVGRQDWQNITISGREFTLNAEKLVIDFDWSALWQKQVRLTELSLARAQIVLPTKSKKEKKEEQTELPEKLPDITLPFSFVAELIALDNVSITQGNKALTEIEVVRGGILYQEQALRLKANAVATQGAVNLELLLQPQSHYPLDLTSDIVFNLPERSEQQQVKVYATGELLKPKIAVDLKGELDAQLALTGRVDLSAQTLNLETDWSGVDYQQRYQSPRGKISANGRFENIHLSLDTSVEGAEIPELTLTGQATVTKDAVEGLDLALQTLGGAVTFAGEADYAQALTWSGVLSIEDIVASRFYPTVQGRLDGVITTYGKQVDNGLEASLSIEALKGAWQGAPISGGGSVYYHNEDLRVDKLNLNLAGNSVEANGGMTNNNLALLVDIQANHLQRLLPSVQGAVNGKMTLGNTLDNPYLNAKLGWRNLAYKDKQSTPIVSSRDGELDIEGLLDSLAVSAKTTLSGESVPSAPSATLTLNTTLNNQQSANDIALNIDTLNGKIQALGDVTFAPFVQWDTQVKVDNIQAKTYVAGLNGGLNAALTSQGSLLNGQVATDTRLSQLKGNWQGQPLTASGAVMMRNGALTLDKFALAVGSNTLEVQGSLDPDNLDIEFDLQGQRLSAFYPELAGSLSGQGKLVGSIKQPNAIVNLKGENLAYQNNKVANVAVVLDSIMNQGGKFNNRIDLQGIDLSGQSWTSVNLASNGTYQQHQLTLNTSGGEINANAQASGGFKGVNQWQGALNRLAVQAYDMNWQMPRATVLFVSPERITVENFCAKDAYSALCVDVKKQQALDLSYQIEALDARSFQAFMPDNLSVSSVLNGQGALKIDAGKMDGQLALNMTPGKIVISPEDSPPLTLKLSQGAVKGVFNDDQADVDLALKFEETGTIAAQTRVNNFSEPALNGRLTLDIPDIGKFRHFVPKVQSLTGKVSGDVRFSGQLPQPQINGELRLENGELNIPEYATELQDIRLKLSAVDTGAINIDGNIGTPKGALTTTGKLFLAPTLLDLSIQGKDMLVANSREIQVALTPSFKVKIDPQTGVAVNGELLIPEAKIAIPDTSSGVSVSKDVVIVKDGASREQATKKPEPSTAISGNIAVKLGDKVFFNTADVKLKLTGGLDLIMRPGQTIRGRGVIEVASGVYVLYGQELNIRQGKVTFSGNNIANPIVEVVAMREVADVEAGAKVSGTANNLVLNLTSDPIMPDSAILSYLLFGRAPDNAMDNEALLQTAASVGMSGVIPEDLAEQTGLDVFDVTVTGLNAGKYLGEDMYVGMRSNFFNSVTQFLARYQFNRRLSAEAVTEAGETAIDFLYEFEKN